jgi:hypothetical protein
MKTLAAVLVLGALVPLARSEEAWRWTDANGTLHYTNRAEVAPPEATPVKTRLIVEVERLPGAPEAVIEGGEVIDAREQRRPPREPRRRARRIYSEERLRFDCYASNILFFGGWAHPEDITVRGNCLPYVLGPEAWLNGARAELALREHGIDWRQVVPMYEAQREAFRAPRTTAASATE